MIKFLNVFDTLADYQAFSASTEYTQPNVALVKETNVLYYDYGDNKPQADMSDFKGEFQDISVGGDKYGKNAIKKINYIPSGITDLDMAFQELPSLEEVTCKIPNSVTSMTQTFYKCTSLVTAPEIPSGVASLDTTFSNCKSLVNAPSVIPSCVTNMSQTFISCKSMVNAPVIPSGVENINSLFMWCSSINEVTLLITTPLKYYQTLIGCSSLESIYVPDESVDAYKTATGWSEFAYKIKPISSKPTE